MKTVESEKCHHVVVHLVGVSRLLWAMIAMLAFVAGWVLGGWQASGWPPWYGPQPCMYEVEPPTPSLPLNEEYSETWLDQNTRRIY